MEKEINFNVTVLNNLIVPVDEALRIQDWLESLDKQNPDLLVPQCKIMVQRERCWNKELMANEHIPYLILRRKDMRAKKFNLSTDFWISKKVKWNGVGFSYTLKSLDEKEDRIVNLTHNDYIQRLVIGLENFIKPKIDYSGYKGAKESFFKALTLIDRGWEKLIKSGNDVDIVARNILFDLWTSWDHKNRVRCMVIIACFHYQRNFDLVKFVWKGKWITIPNNWGLRKIIEEIR